MNRAQLKHWLDTRLQTIISLPEQVVAERNLLLAHFLGLSAQDMLMAPEQPIPETPALDALKAAVDERLTRRLPLQYLLGEAVFYGLTFAVTPDTLIPRPETELLVEQALAFCQHQPVQTALDLGTGSGCIAITLKHHCPTLAVTAVDISAAALAVARQNAHAHHADIRFIQGAWFQPVSSERFDLILSNPPYISDLDRETLSPEVLHEPHLALFPPDDPVAFYRHLLQEIRGHLNPGGAFFVEMGMGQGPMLLEMAQSLGFAARLIPDYGGIPRILAGQ